MVPFDDGYVNGLKFFLQYESPRFSFIFSPQRSLPEMAASAEITDGDHAVELILRDASPPTPDDLIPSGGDSVSEEITPLLSQSMKPKINIFSVSYSRRTREQVIKSYETETSPATQFVSWIWGGSRYSGLLCVAVSSTMYFLMEVISDTFSVQSIPLFESAFTRCTVLAILSYVWLRMKGHPIFGPANARKLLISRAIMGYLSLSSFIFCIQRLPLSQAIVLSFTTPIMASIVARIMLREKLKIAEIGGLACSFFGVLFIFRHILTTKGGLLSAGETTTKTVRGSCHVYAVFAGLVSSVTGGISYCLIKTAAKSSDQPVGTVFSFGILGSPAAAICTFVFEEFMLPDVYSFFVMVILGVIAFFAEVFLARGLQFEKTSKAANVQYIEVALLQIWGIVSLRILPSFGGFTGCLLILISVCCTMYIGPDKEME